MKRQEYSDIITMWVGDFETIMDLIPLNGEGMFAALAFHSQVDAPWEEKEEELREKEENEDRALLCNICNDICEIFQKAANGEGRAFIKYYY